MRIVLLEGTPEEISQVLPLIKTDGGGVVGGAPASTKAAPQPLANGAAYVSVPIARRILNRRSLSAEQVKLLKALHEAAPKPVLATELQNILKYSAAQFAGLMGAFGRRVSHTEGHVEGTWFFDQEWDYAHNCYRYTLPESVREALQSEGLV